ncbi:MAG: cyclic nucleotide-binding domain-containing protein [Pseudobdellovibrio sp.]
MSDIKVIKKGQFLFKAGDKIQSVFVIQSGQVNLCLQKNNKIIDIMTVGNGYVFGDLVVLGTSQYLYSGLAMQELKVTEVPLDVFKAQYESLNPVNKSFIKTLADKLKWAVNEVKNSKQDRSAVPCSEDSIPRVFGSIFHVLNHKGLKDGNRAKTDWLTLRNYSQRIFGESLKRVEQATQILVKLKQAEYVMGRDPNNPDPEAQTEIQGFELYDLPALEAFFEFYQYYYYKGGKSELLKYDEANYSSLRLLLLSYEGVVPDKYGVVSKDFNEVVEFFKDYGVSLGAGHFTALEAKGLFCKRKNAADGKVQLQFDVKEFKTQIDIWALIKEIDKLNEKGFVDLADTDDGPKKKTAIAGVACGQCQSIVSLESKFCGECGAKVVSKLAGAVPEKKAA